MLFHKHRRIHLLYARLCVVSKEQIIVDIIVSLSWSFPVIVVITAVIVVVILVMSSSLKAQVSRLCDQYAGGVGIDK